MNTSLITASFAEVTELAFLNISLDSLNFDGVNLVTGAVKASNPCNAGNAVFGAFPNFPSQAALAPCFTSGSFGRVRPISPNLKNAEIRHGNLSFQRQLGNTAALNVEYIGAFGFGQFGESDTNFPPIIAIPPTPASSTSETGPIRALRRCAPIRTRALRRITGLSWT